MTKYFSLISTPKIFGSCFSGMVKAAELINPVKVGVEIKSTIGPRRSSPIRIKIHPLIKDSSSASCGEDGLILSIGFGHDSGHEINEAMRAAEIAFGRVGHFEDFGQKSRI